MLADAYMRVRHFSVTLEIFRGQRRMSQSQITNLPPMATPPKPFKMPPSHFMSSFFSCYLDDLAVYQTQATR